MQLVKLALKSVNFMLGFSSLPLWIYITFYINTLTSIHIVYEPITDTTEFFKLVQTKHVL